VALGSRVGQGGTREHEPWHLPLVYRVLLGHAHRRGTTLSMQLLLVDDDASMLALLRQLLDSAGHEVDACASGAEALALLQRKTYAALLTDLVMPAMNGLDLVREARTLVTGLRCIIITGHDPPPEAERDGVTWLSKPLDFDRLLAALTP
jgi:DNA-binding NtrC family response regulator